MLGYVNWKKSFGLGWVMRNDFDCAWKWEMGNSWEMGNNTGIYICVRYGHLNCAFFLILGLPWVGIIIMIINIKVSSGRGLLVWVTHIQRFFGSGFGSGAQGG